MASVTIYDGNISTSTDISDKIIKAINMFIVVNPIVIKQLQIKYRVIYDQKCQIK